MRIRPTLLCVAALVALSFPGPAAADTSGGVAAPNGSGGSGSGGGTYGTPVPAAKKQTRTPARPRRRAPAPAGEHVFPVAGPFSLGGNDAAFGAPRSGHRHQGHDISAARGTPVVAPCSGAVEWVRYQRGGAGHYVVLGADDGYDYIFMHLRRGSIQVVAGQRVAAGEPIGEVGNSGRSIGAHLHFEVWVGGWYEKGGEPIDPLPLLRDWAIR